MVNSKLFPQIFAAASASLITIGTGFHSGWSSPSLAKLLAEDSDIPVTSDQGSWIVSFNLIGCICGAIIAVPIVDKFGRKTSLLVMAAPQFVGCLLIVFARSYWWFYLARFIVGLSIGTAYTIIPMYIGEIAENRVRGSLGIVMRVLTDIGHLIPYTIGPWVSVATLGAVGAVIPIIFVLTFAWAPESPYYWAMKSAPCKIEKSLAWLRGKSDVGDEVLIIQNNVKLNEINKGSITDLFVVKSNRKALGIFIGLATCRELSGHPAIVAYSTIIFNEVDSGISSGVSVIIMGLVKCLTTVSIVFLIDKLGRRPLLLTSTSLCAVFLLCEALYFHLRASEAEVTSISWLPLVGVIGYLISFAIGIGNLALPMAGEIFRCEIKALAITLGVIYLGVAAVGTTKFYQIVSDAYGIHVPFYTFGICSIGFTVFIFFFVPETKGRSLSEIQAMLQGSSKSVL